MVNKNILQAQDIVDASSLQVQKNGLKSIIQFIFFKVGLTGGLNPRLYLLGQSSQLLLIDKSRAQSLCFQY